MAIDLEAGDKTHQFELPAAFRKKNVLVPVTGAGIQTSAVPYANQLEVEIAANYGRLQMRHSETDKPLVKAYVKVYARTPNGPNFYKEGSTDLRGKFDYTSPNTDGLG